MSTERSERFHVNLQVVYDDGENFMSAPVIDVSESGMFIETVMPLEPGKRLRITPLLPEDAGLFEFEGEVVRANEYDLDEHYDRTPGMGVRFVDISDEDKANLHGLFKKHEAGRKAADAESK